MIKFIDSLIAWLSNPGLRAAELAAAIRSAGSLWSSTETQSKLDEKITSIQAGENVTINWLDPLSPIINAQGTGFGDMAASMYDPTGVEADAFDRANHHGNTPAANVSGLATVATSGSYNDLSDTPPAGGDVTGPAGATAGNFPVLDATGKILSDSGYAPVDFATAADGLLAQSAVQPAEIADMLETSDIGSSVQGYDADTAKTDADRQWTAPQRGSVSALSVSGGNIAWDLATNNDFSVTLTANATLQFPSNASTRVGQKGRIYIVQDGTGGRTFAVASGLKVLGSASLPNVLTGANAESYLAYDVISTTTIAISLAGVGG